MSFELSLQAKVIGIVFLLCQFVNVISSVILQEFVLTTVIATFVVLLFAAILMFDTHCLTKGPCETWSWIRTCLYSLSVIINVIVMIWIMVQIKKTRKAITQEQTTKLQDHFFVNATPQPIYIEESSPYATYAATQNISLD
jgi:protein-S-isoprenylcysteine O-methyltransferase Ste14